MSKRAVRFCILTLSVAAVGAACSESTAPSTASLTSGLETEQQALLGGLLGTLTQTVSSLLVPPITRNTPLESDVTWSFTAGPAGAASVNPGVGLTIVIPPYALSSTQTVTITALKGSAVAYKFGPHGLQFARKVTLTQDLRGTSAGTLLGSLLSSLELQGAYFATDRLETTTDGLATVTELIPAVTSVLTYTASFPITHFSGYIVASGRGSDAESAY